LKFVNIGILILFFILLIYASFGLPSRGDEGAVINRESSPSGSPNAASYYIRNAYKDTHTPNMVTAILADYRGYDTLGEETVILTAGLICFLLLRRESRKKDEGTEHDEEE
jgi:multicomponent Na+:H+ antiporter subunit B